MVRNLRRGFFGMGVVVGVIVSKEEDCRYGSSSVVGKSLPYV